MIIGSTSRNPIILSSQQQITIGALTVVSGSSLTITDSLARLLVKGDVHVYGTLNLTPLTSNTTLLVGGSWIVKPGGPTSVEREYPFVAQSDLGFVPARSTVYLSGIGTVEKNFFNLIFDTTSTITSSGNLHVQNQCTVLNDLQLRSTDTLFIQNPIPQALVGYNNVNRGTIQRLIQQNADQPYRFESESTYVRFHNSGLYPATVAMTSYPDSNLALNGALWDVVPGTLDTIANTILVDSVTHFSKWAIGIVRPGSGIENPAATDTVILRFYDVAVDVDSGFLAQLSLRYEQSELPAGASENSIRLFRSEIVVGVQEENHQLPASFSLEQNYPNPFNPVTVIKYQLPVQSYVTLRVYNILGQVVATLVNGVQEAGYESPNFDAGNLASGVYFYKIEATGVDDSRRSFSDVRKMVVIR